MIYRLQEYVNGRTQLAEGPLKARFKLNIQYVMSLTNQNLLRNFYLEAGLWSYSGNGGTTSASTTNKDGPEHWHWGWESPTCELRGHIMGHWLSAAARIYAQTKDPMVKAKADTIVQELARCQEANGGEWLAAFPASYMHRIVEGKWVWAPHYTVHKILMGLYEMYKVAGNEQALEIMIKMASWFYRWMGQLTRDQLDELLDMETGGMLEVWADLYGLTKAEEHRELIYRYDRRRFFDALLDGKDVLTNKHANTQIPEILGAARAWEVTGDERFRRIVLAFWQCAVTDRGYVSTGAGDDAELWMPPGHMAERMGVGQEHCCNYNMMRLAQVLLRWTGNPVYADYWERRFINGVLAHQHGETGMISYFLGVGAGSKKNWGSPTQHFWCCHGTLIQANAAYETEIFMRDEEGFVVNQWIPSKLETEWNGTRIGFSLTQNGQSGLYPLNGWSVKGMTAITRVDIPSIPVHRPDRFVYDLTVTCEQPSDFTISIRLPWWLAGEPVIQVNGIPYAGSFKPSSYCKISGRWNSGDTIQVAFPKRLIAEPLPGQAGTIAFLDGPIVLAGLTSEERRLSGNPEAPESMLIPDRERNHSWWNPGYYRTKDQERGIRFIPLYEVKDEAYSVYFPIEKRL
ncbi:beta-L-arabinofuranosidase domain-containing protein [Paenibacillus arenilitoris]|uniref:Glycoside hydrolase family 127 protein n=1 Tax=Paenibacillus arenilitoris TaxID=2772299 RepID=A0A927CJ83_9BACL|nr:beta-L-arabinofuranosidase domain-containing protein [Paenibacillus arenilitoris]MBD2868470.1 glycoside hydrolase family 127 protein [Paenibacillus arenilitoris]